MTSAMQLSMLITTKIIVRFLTSHAINAGEAIKGYKNKFYDKYIEDICFFLGEHQIYFIE